MNLKIKLAQSFRSTHIGIEYTYIYSDEYSYIYMIIYVWRAWLSFGFSISNEDPHAWLSEIICTGRILLICVVISTRRHVHEYVPVCQHEARFHRVLSFVPYYYKLRQFHYVRNIKCRHAVRRMKICTSCVTVVVPLESETRVRACLWLGYIEDTCN
jgi:hypothetical protein